MNERIQAILLKIVLELKKLGWKASQDWEVTLKSDNQVPLTKAIDIKANLGAKEWVDQVETYIELKLVSDDQLTYFPEYSLYATIHMDGGRAKDLAFKLNVDVAFTAQDMRDEKKINIAAKKIDRLTQLHVDQAYSDYLDTYSAGIQSASSPEGLKADDDSHRDR